MSDSGASNHFCGNAEWFITYQRHDPPQIVTIADNQHAIIVGEGTAEVKAYRQRKWDRVLINNVLHVPGGANLFSETVMQGKKWRIYKDEFGDTLS